MGEADSKVSAPKEMLRRRTSDGTLVVVAVDAACHLDALEADERRLGERRAELVRPPFVAGRLALRAALAAEGAPIASILHDDRGAPVTPSGFVGSISHKTSVAVGLARPADGARVGVDVEIEKVGRVDISSRVLTDPELEELARVDEGARARFTLLRFSMKEAVYKAIDPYLRRYVGFREVELVPRDAGRYDAVFVAPGAAERSLVVSAHSEIVDVEIGRLIVSTATAFER